MIPIYFVTNKMSFQINSTGGVIMGTAGDLELYPAVAVGCGIIAGVVSVLGYHFLTPALNNYLWMQDICGVHNLHGIPVRWVLSHA